MNKYIILPLFLTFFCISLFAQPKIISVSYDGDKATLTRNDPPDGIVYYWQGSSCDMLMNHSGSTTIASSSGTYFLMEYNSTDDIWATSCASTVVFFQDVTPPVLSDVTEGPVEEGDPIAATSNEAGVIYLVPDGTAATVGDIDAAKVAEAAATEDVPVSLPTGGIILGDYVVYATDTSDNVSIASAAITIVDLTAPVLSDVTEGPIEEGDPIAATSNEAGMIYLVPDGTAASIGDIGTAKFAEAAATASVAVSLSTSGITAGDYVVYAVDGSENISTASSAITIDWASYIDLDGANSDKVQIYPGSVEGILYIKSKLLVSSAKVYSIQGSQMLSLSGSRDQIDMSGLEAGIYIISIRLVDNSVYSTKVTKR